MSGATTLSGFVPVIHDTFSVVLIHVLGNFALQDSLYHHHARLIASLGMFLSALKREQDGTRFFLRNLPQRKHVLWSTAF